MSLQIKKSRIYCHLFAPKIGTRPIRLTPPIRLVSLNGLTGGVSCSRSGNGHTGLTGGPDWSDRWTPSPGRIVESLRISSCKRIPCRARPPHPINTTINPLIYDEIHITFFNFIIDRIAFMTNSQISS
jgi:hypothetical protein